MFCKIMLKVVLELFCLVSKCGWFLFFEDVGLNFKCDGVVNF